MSTIDSGHLDQHKPNRQSGFTKRLRSGRDDLKIKTQGAKIGVTAKAQTKALLDDPDVAAGTMGHIPYFSQLRAVAEAMEDDGDNKGAVALMKKTIKVMKDRKIIQRVIDNAEARLDRRT